MLRPEERIDDQPPSGSGHAPERHRVYPPPQAAPPAIDAANNPHQFELWDLLDR